MWIVFSLLSRFLWAGCNAADQVLTRTQTNTHALSAYILIGFASLPFGLALMLAGGNEAATLTAIWPWLLVGAAAECLGLLPYYEALRKEEAYNAIPYLELTPVFLTALACLFFGEHMGWLQITGSMVVIASGFLFSWDFRRSKFHTRTLAYMALASLFFAVYQLSVRGAAQGQNVMSIAGCFIAMQGLISMAAFALMPRTRAGIVASARLHPVKTPVLAILTNVLSLAALVSLAHAFNTAPSTGHVAALSGVQPFFSFFLAAVLALLYPADFKAVIFDRSIRHKLLLLAAIFAGIAMLSMGG